MGSHNLKEQAIAGGFLSYRHNGEMQAKPGFVRPEDDPKAVAARKNCGGATEKAEQQSQYAKGPREMSLWSKI